MTSTTTVTLTADTELEHHLVPADIDGSDGPWVRVDVGAAGHALSIWARDADDLTRLAAELTSAANCLGGLGCGEPA